MMNSRQFAITSAHAVASEFVRLGIVVPDREVVSTAIVEDAGVRVVVSITKYDGPARLYPTPEGAEALGLPMMPTTPATPRLTPLQKSIVEMLNDDKPTKLTVIWSRLGRKGSPSGSFRCVVADLVRFGVITHVPRQGYLRASLHNP